MLLTPWAIFLWENLKAQRSSDGETRAGHGDALLNACAAPNPGLFAMPIKG
jgi:hypothetical protein